MPLPVSVVSGDVIDLTADTDLTGSSSHARNGSATSALDTPARRTAFFDQLADPSCWPIAEHRGALTRFLGAALLQWDRWPSGLGLDISGQNAHNVENAQPILVAESHCENRLTVTYDSIKGQDLCSVYLSRGGSLDSTSFAGASADWREFPGLPNGFFDAVAAGLAMVRPHAPPWEAAPLTTSAGQWLRESLVLWLRQAPERLLGERPRDVNWVRASAPGPSIAGPVATRRASDLSDFSDFFDSAALDDLADLADLADFSAPTADPHASDVTALTDVADSTAYAGTVDASVFSDVSNPGDPQAPEALEPPQLPSAAALPPPCAMPGPSGTSGPLVLIVGQPRATKRIRLRPRFESVLTAPTGAQPPPATVEEARALVESLRAGGWNDTLQPVVCHALARLTHRDPSPFIAVDGFMLERQGQPAASFGYAYTRYNRPAPRGIDIAGPPAHPRYTARIGIRGSRTEGPYDGEDGLLMAYCALAQKKSISTALGRMAPETSSGWRHDTARKLRERLSETLNEHLDFVRVCLTLHRIWPTSTDHEPMLRQCVNEDGLTWEGQQLLTPALIRCPLTSEDDVQRLLKIPFGPGERRRRLFELGHPMLAAHQLLSPSGFSPLVGRYARPNPDELLQAIDAEGAWQLHVWGHWAAVVRHLGFASMEALGALLGPERTKRWERDAALTSRGTRFLPTDQGTPWAPAVTPQARTAPAGPPLPPGPTIRASREVAASGTPGTASIAAATETAGTPEAASRSARAKLALLPAPVTNAAPASVAEALALMDACGRSQWGVEALPVLCHVLTALKPRVGSLAGAVQRLQLVRENGHFTRFGFGFSAGRVELCQIQWRQESTDSVIYSVRRNFSRTWTGPFRGPLGLFRAYCALASDTWREALNCPSTDPLQEAERLHRLVCNLLPAQVTSVRLCMTLHRMWPDYPQPDILLRQCLQEGVLSWEGQQVLYPSLIRRPLTTRDDIAALIRLNFPPGERRRRLFDLGYPLLQAHQLLSPIGPTPLSVLNSHMRDATRHLPALRAEGGWLLYAYGTWTTLMHYLGGHPKAIQRLVDQDEFERWSREAIALTEASLLARTERAPSPART